MFLVKIPFTHLGYNAGYKEVDTIAENAKKIAHAATILGVTVVSALIANYVHITLLPEITMGERNVVNIQKYLIDTIFPKLLPFLYTILMYYLMKFKKVKSTTLIITFLGVMVLSYLGIL